MNLNPPLVLTNPAPDNPFRDDPRSWRNYNDDYTPPASPTPLPLPPRELKLPHSTGLDDRVDIVTISGTMLSLANVSMLSHFPDMLQHLIAPKCPPMYSNKACAGTAKPKPLAEDAPYGTTGRIPLKMVVIHPQMIGTDLLHYINKTFSVDTTRVNPSLTGPHVFFWAKVHPQITKSGFPPVIQSEKDVEYMDKAAHLDPTLHCLATAAAGQIVLKDDTDYYAVSAAGTKYPIPDILVYHGGAVRAVVEAKTPNALANTVKFFRSGPSIENCESLFAMRYHQATSSEKVGGSKDKILQQVRLTGFYIFGRFLISAQTVMFRFGIKWSRKKPTSAY